MINLTIDDEMKAIAQKHSEERMQYEYNRFKFNYEKRKNMILVGSLGQLVFKKFLDENNIPYKFQFQAGNYDDYDFKINGDIFEVKASGYEHSFSYLNLLYSDDQYRAGLKKGFKYCVQIFINGLDLDTKILDLNCATEATIAGYIEFDRIRLYKQEKKHYGDDYKVPISDLKDIENLL